MSDCGANTTKANLPRTCGTCANFAMEPLRDRSGACLASYDDTPISGYVCVGSNDLCQRPSRYTERTEDLEQRRQQLEQLAREMYLFIALDEGLRTITLRAQRKTTDLILNCEKFRKRLEDLGVSVDS